MNFFTIPRITLLTLDTTSNEASYCLLPLPLAALVRVRQTLFEAKLKSWISKRDAASMVCAVVVIIVEIAGRVLEDWRSKSAILAGGRSAICVEAALRLGAVDNLLS